MGYMSRFCLNAITIGDEKLLRLQIAFIVDGVDIERGMEARIITQYFGIEY